MIRIFCFSIHGTPMLYSYYFVSLRSWAFHQKIFMLINWPDVSYHDNIFILFCDGIENIIMDDSLNNN